MGDFNEIMWSTEKRGGLAWAWHNMNRFREVARYCGLRYLRYEGFVFTWSNGRTGEFNIKERLDRAMATQGWRRNRPQKSVKHLSRFQSDMPHC